MSSHRVRSHDLGLVESLVDQVREAVAHDLGLQCGEPLPAFDALHPGGSRRLTWDRLRSACLATRSCECRSDPARNHQ